MLRPRVVDLRTRRALVNGLRVFWVLVVLWCESGAFLWSLLDCRWPDQNPTSLPSPTHVLLISDPQILDDRSYPGRPNWLMTLTQYVVDFNLRKSWNAVLTRVEPHVVVFLGDMMDSGRENMDDNEYAQYYTRFKSIFRLHSGTPVFYLPGNHDVGLGSLLRHSSRARNRYERHFGPLNQRLEIANHTFVLLDAPGLVDDDHHRNTGESREEQVTEGGTNAFLRDLAQQQPNGPVVLFSHIPLSRSGRSSCGPLREKGTIRPGAGLGYQNLLPRDTSAFILKNIRPAVIFSGDDHDYCDYVHTLADGSKVREVTVKSFSIAMGIQRPGFQLLSLFPVETTAKSSPSHSPITFADKACLLPDQIKIYTHGYAAVFGLTLLFLIIFNYRHRRRYHLAQPISRVEMEARLHPLLRWVLPSRLFLTIGRSVSKQAQENGQRFDSYDMSSETVDPDSVENGEANTHDASAPGMWLAPDRRTTFAPRGARSRVWRVWDRTPCAGWVSGGGSYSWYGNVARDLWQVAPPALGLYLIISLYAFWR